MLFCTWIIENLVAIIKSGEYMSAMFFTSSAWKIPIKANSFKRKCRDLSYLLKLRLPVEVAGSKAEQNNTTTAKLSKSTLK